MNTQKEESIYIKIQEWLDEYHSTTKRKLKKNLENLIVVGMMPIIKKIAKTIARRATDPVEDLIQAGAIGLIKAIQKYDKEKNKAFKVYSGYLIVGEMKNYLRDKVALIKVPKEIIELTIRIDNFSKNLTEKEIEKLTDEDVAKALDIPVQKVHDAYEYDRRRKIISLDEVANSDQETSVSVGEITPSCDYSEFLEKYDRKIELEQFIERLPKDLKEIIIMFYYDDKKQKDIADILNLSEMMVSRKIKKAYSIIYDAMKDSEGLG